MPVNPPSISIQSDYGWEDVEITHLGEYSVPGNARLRDFSFSSFFPRDYNPSYCEYENVPDPWTAVQKIEQWAKSRKPIRLTITGTPINVAVTIRSFSIDPERAGAPGDIYYDLALKEYVFVDVKKVDISGNTATVSAITQRADNRTKPSTYTVKPGDNLTKIALKYGGTARNLYAKNAKVIGPDPNYLRVGMVLKLA